MKISPPPWEANGNGVHKGVSCVAITSQTGMFEEQYANASFIAHAPEDVDYLLSEVERLNKIIADMAQGVVAMADATRNIHKKY